MGNLPEARVGSLKEILNTGMDFRNPIYDKKKNVNSNVINELRYVFYLHDDQGNSSGGCNRFIFRCIPSSPH